MGKSLTGKKKRIIRQAIIRVRRLPVDEQTPGLKAIAREYGTSYTSIRLMAKEVTSGE